MGFNVRERARKASMSLRRRMSTVPIVDAVPVGGGGAAAAAEERPWWDVEETPQTQTEGSSLVARQNQVPVYPELVVAGATETTGRPSEAVVAARVVSERALLGGQGSALSPHDFVSTVQVDRGIRPLPAALRGGASATAEHIRKLRRGAHPHMRRKTERYLVAPGRVKLLADLLSFAAQGAAEFEATEMMMRVEGSQEFFLKESHRDGTAQYPLLRCAGAYPVQVHDNYSAIALLAERSPQGGITYDSLAGRVATARDPPYILLNWRCRGIAHAANRIHSLYTREGCFPLRGSASELSESSTMELAKRLQRVLRYMAQMPAVAPAMGLGGAFGVESDFRCEYAHFRMVPAAVRIRTGLHEIASDLPSMHLESLVRLEALMSPAELRDMKRETLDGTGLVMYSPHFAPLVHDEPLQLEPAENEALAVSMLFQLPMIIDRTGTLHDPVVVTTVLDRVPAAKEGTFSSAAQSQSPSQALYQTAATCKGSRQAFALGAASGLNALMVETAQQAIEQSRLTGLNRVQVIWDGSLDATAMLAAFIALPGLTSLQPGSIQVAYLSSAVNDSNRPFWRKWLADGMPKSHRAYIEVSCIADEETSEADILDLENSIVVVPSHCNLIFGSSMYRGVYSTEEEVLGLGPAVAGTLGSQLGELWQPAVRRMLERSRLFRDKPAVGEALLGRLHEQAETAPFQLQTLRDYLWWVSFTLEWQHESLSRLASVAYLDISMASNLFGFFRTDAWQQWAVAADHHRFLKFPNLANPASYKMLLKAFIIETTAKKMTSYSRALWKSTDNFGAPSKAGTQFLAIDDSFRVISTPGASMSTTALKSKYGSSVQRYLQ